MDNGRNFMSILSSHTRIDLPSEQGVRHFPEYQQVEQRVHGAINGFATRLLSQLHDSHLPGHIKMQVATELADGRIQPGVLAVERKTVPETVTAGSFDPPTHGHMNMVRETEKIDPNCGVIVVKSTSKPADYQLFSPIERSGLLRILGYKGTIILGEGNEEMDDLTVLRQLHTLPRRIVKGRRNDEDSRHTKSLVHKYGIDDKFVEVVTPGEMATMSSGFVKGILAQQKRIESVASHTHEDVLRVTLAAIHGRPDHRNQIFLERLNVESSEQLFHT